MLGDDRVLADFKPLAELRQLLGVFGAAERLGEPVAQRRSRAAAGRMRGDDLLLAELKRPVEVVGEDHVVGDELAIAKGVAELGRQVHQHEARAALVGGALDLDEAVHGGGIDAGDQTKIEQQEAGLRAPGEEFFHLLVETVGRAEEDIALQAHALDLACPWAPSTASSSGARSSVERYSDPSKLNLIAFTRLALTAKVVQPMTMPISTPAMKPT